MKYIREKNGKREIVEKKRHSQAYIVQAILKWTICIGLLLIAVLVFRFLDKKLNDGKIVDKIIGKKEAPKTPSVETEQPIETETEEAPVLRVCLDPGHGGMDPGCDYDGRIESEDNWKLAQVVKQEMEAAGMEVVMTREDNDTKVFLKDRVAIAIVSERA